MRTRWLATMALLTSMAIASNAPAANILSMSYEQKTDELLLKVRIERLKSPRSFSQHQPSFCQHVLQQPVLESTDADAGGWVTRTPFVYVESQGDTQLLLAGVSRLHREQDGRLRMRPESRPDHARSRLAVDPAVS
jgi:hypothetical protein